MSNPIQVFVFGDQTYDVCELLSTLLRIQDDFILSTFLDKSCQTLKVEISKLRHELQTACPRFSKISDLLSLSRQGLLNPALTQALSCVCQIGIFLHEHVLPGKAFPTSNYSCLTGRCTGFLSAVAVSCSSSPVDLSLLGVTAVAIAFRVGAVAWDLGSRLSSTRNGTKPYPSWTVALSGPLESEVQACIEQFVSRKAISNILAPYVSARITPSRCSLSGRPDILHDLLSETPLSQSVTLALPITAPYHAEHLYTEDDICGVLSDIDAWASNLKVLIPIISSSTGDLIWRTTFSDALHTSVRSCLQHIVRADLVPTSVATYIRTVGEAAQFVIRRIAATPDALGMTIEDALVRQSSTGHIKVEPHLEALPKLDSSSTASSKIAIISMSGRFPSAPNMESFWHVLENGIDTHEKVPQSRWNVRTHVGDASSNRLAKNISGTGFGCWLHDAAQFDARFFNMSPREAPQVDPAQRLALLTATEAIEQAGIVPGRTASTHRDRVGVYFGSTSNDWMETNSAQNIDTYFIPGGNRAFIPGRINYHFKFSGPSYTIDTACSSSLAAIHLACNALWKGEIDTAIVGGTNVLTNPDMTAGLDRGHFLSRTGNCKTFDDTADGYCRGEAVATAILKRLDDAIIDKDPIQACILAINTNHSAEADSITRPHVGAQQALFEDVLADAGIQPSDVGYCEMHGTGTQAGDASEVVSVLQALAPGTPSKATQSRQECLYIGAAKANVGHGEAAAGVTSLAKVLLMLKHSVIPPHCGIKTTINHKFPDLASRNTAIATQSLSWPRPVNGRRRILLNNFSAAGGNTALVLEDPPAIPVSKSKDDRQHHIIAVSAKTPASLEKNLANLIAWIDTQEDKSDLILSRLSYTTTARRIHHAHRVMIIATHLESAKKSFLKSIDCKEGAHRAKGTPRFLFTFTGQGAQYAGMGVDLYKRLSAFRADIRRYEQICLQLQLPSIEHLFKDTTSFAEATPTMLQLALVCFQMALYRMWVSFGIEPSAVVGHSLGEYAALYAASVLSQADAISLVGRRAQLLETVCVRDSHAMLAIGSNVSRLEDLLGPPGAEYEISCLNGRENTVLGGTKTQLRAIRPTLSRSGLSHTFLEVPYAFHTSQVDPVLESLRSLASGVQFAKPAIPVISPTYGKVLAQADEFGADFVVKHCRVKVDMIGALKAAKDMGVIEDKMMGVEIGPAPIVVKMVKETIGPAFQTFSSSRRDEDVHKLLATSLGAFYAAGATIDWMAYHADFPACHQVLDLPAYGWDLSEYWIQYVNDWSPRKGDPPLYSQIARLKSSSIHQVLEDTLSISGGDLILESDLSRADLHPMVQGHKVYGVPLCTPSVYADIALTIGEYAKVFLQLISDDFAVEVADMAIHSALVASPDGVPQMLRTVACMNHTKKSISCTFSTLHDSGKIPNQHATCVIRLFNVQEALGRLEAQFSHTKSQISSLMDRVREFGNTFRYSKGMIYKMVGQLADFDPKYRALEEITLDSDAFEAVGRVDFTKVVGEGTFHTNPAQIDALSQLGGFVMNGNEGVDLGKELFVNHGWGSLRLLSEIEPSKIYTTYVKMVEGANKLWTGDIIIMCEENVVGVFDQVALQGVPKRLMEYIVRSANKPLLDPSLHNLADGSLPQTRVSSHVETNANRTMYEPVVHQQPAAMTTYTTAINIISQESGIGVKELTDDVRFDDVGVDSLLSLMISSRFRDELGINFESSVLLDLPTVGDFLTYLKGITIDDEQLVPITEPVREKVMSINIAMSSARENKDSIDIWPGVLTIIAEEIGISTRDLTRDTVFADIGMDSLLSLIVSGRLRDELQIDFPSQSLFLDFPTVVSLQAHITGRSQDFEIEERVDSDLSATSSCLSLDAPTTATPPSESAAVSIDTSKAHISRVIPLIKPAWSIILQGSARTATHQLFLFPDGCGAATSYLKLPLISSNTAVIGFNSPFMKSPHDMASHSLSDVVTSYIQGLQRHQPRGPYHLGGWSAGGILAYAVAQELIAAGEEITTLTLIDSPPPNNGLDRLPRRFFDHCSKVGIFGTEMSAISRQRDSVSEVPKLPDWLMPHFEATIELLHDYRAPPMSPTASSPGKVNIIWAEACAFNGDYAPLPLRSSELEETEGMKFLTEQRKDFGPGKWSDLFPGRSIHLDVVRGHHHFSMMRGDGAELLAQVLRKALKAAD